MNLNNKKNKKKNPQPNKNIKEILEEKIITEYIRIRKKHDIRYRLIIKKAAELIANGNVIVFPTETVYGLGANAYDPNAVSMIYKIKNRPADNPLIVHVSSRDMALGLVTEFNKDAEILTSKFWPGPLTIILPKSKQVPDITVSGLPTIAVRMPNHDIALDIIKAASVPIAAPSANLSGKPSITKGKYALEELKGKVNLIIDAGPSKIGIESTVVDLTSPQLRILREGLISKEDIEKTLNKEVIICRESEVTLAPGMKYKHYSPAAKVYLLKSRDERLKIIEKMIDIRQSTYKESKEKKIMFVFPYALPLSFVKRIEENTIEENTKVIVFENETKMAHDIFDIFRKADKEGIEAIIIESPLEHKIGCALVDRLTRAADEIIEL